MMNHHDFKILINERTLVYWQIQDMVQIITNFFEEKKDHSGNLFKHIGETHKRSTICFAV